MAKLIFTDPSFSGRTYDLSLEKTTIGRSESNVLVIRDDSVSARHCEILVYGSEVIVRDVGSSNGTFVNGARLQNQQTFLKSGYTISFGTVEARVEINPETISDGDTDMTAIITHARAMRDQRRALANPAPNPAERLEHLQAAPPQEHTILFPREQN
jgi:pSer/pThr/pTyr-binding forkhead associated (FHA) protein